MPLTLPGEERIERGVITIDDCFCEDDVVETNVSSDSVDGPKSGLIDVVALRIRVRMERLSSVMIVVVGSKYGKQCLVVKNCISDAPSPLAGKIYTPAL